MEGLVLFRGRLTTPAGRRTQGDMNKDLFERNEDLATVRFIDTQRDRVAGLERQLDDAGVPPPYLDQYPAKRRPAIYPRIIGPTGMVCAGRLSAGATGFLALAPLVNTAEYLVPQDPIIIGREKLFHLTHINVACFVSWTYAENPGFDAPIDTRPPAGLFDPVFEANGGASLLLNHSQGADALPANAANAAIRPRAYFDIELYDEKRGRSLTDGALPGELVLGGAVENKAVSGFSDVVVNKGYRFDVDTIIQPRLYVREVRMSQVLDGNVPYEAARVAVWFQVMLMGFNTYAIAKDARWHELESSNVGFNAPPRRF